MKIGDKFASNEWRHKYLFLQSCKLLSNLSNIFVFNFFISSPKEKCDPWFCSSTLPEVVRHPFRIFSFYSFLGDSFRLFYILHFLSKLFHSLSSGKNLAVSRNFFLY